MGNFHRFVDPTYDLFGGESFPALPGGTGTIGLHTYDRVNVISGGTGGSGSANADTQKGVGPNEYTYFVAFGEDATSSHANRGLKAIGENTDVLDELFRTNVPKWGMLPITNPAANRVALTGDIFVGDDALGNAADLIFLTDSSGRRLYNGTTPVAVTDIDDGTPGSSVVGSGWYTNPTVQLNTLVNVNLQAYVGVRSSTARMIEEEREALWLGWIQSSVRGVAGSSTSRHGLDERYRRATHITSAAPAADTPGSGATIQRDGQAVEVVNNAVDYVTVPKQYQDPYLSLMKVTPQELDQTSDGDYSGYIGFLAMTPRQDTGESSSVEATALGLPFAGFMSAVPRDIRANTLDGKVTLTRVNSTAGAILNPDSGSGDNARVVQLNASDYFVNSNGYTGVRVGYDMLEVTWDSGLATEHKEVYVITEVNVTGTTPARRCYVRTLGGEKPTFAGADTVKVRWVQPVFMAGAGLNGIWQDFEPRPFASLHAGALSETFTANSLKAPLFETWPNNPRHGASRQSAFVVAGFDRETGKRDDIFWANSEGLLFTRQRIIGALTADVGQSGTAFKSYSSSGSLEWAPDSNPDSSADVMGPSIYIRFTGAGPITLNVTLDATYVASYYEGDRLTIFIYNQDGANVTINWPGGALPFQFSAGDDVVPADAGYVIKYEGVVRFIDSSRIWVTRTDYDLSP